MARITGFFHGGITVSDMDRSLRFYHDGLGLEVLFDRLLDGPYLPVVLNLRFDRLRAVYLIVPGGGHIELLEYQGIERMPARSRPCDPGSGHLCLYVDDVEAMHAQLVGMGYSSRSGSVVDITQGPNAGARSCYMADPDGYAVELFQKPAA
jgi:catechol 2,3-dioxygenase-like lactoylglutathione lyase family enzyme